MAPVIIVFGYGPATGHSVALKFGGEGFSVVCVGRTKSKLDEGVEALKAKNISASAFTCDCADAAKVKELIGEIRSSLGSDDKITTIHWNVSCPRGVGGDLLESDPEALQDVVNSVCVGLLASVQAAVEDLKESQGSVLITGGGLSSYHDKVDQMALDWKCMGLAFCKSNQRKLAGLLHVRLKPLGVMVGTVVVSGAVRGTGFDSGDGSAMDPAIIAEKFWDLHKLRQDEYAVALPMMG